LRSDGVVVQRNILVIEPPPRPLPSVASTPPGQEGQSAPLQFVRTFVLFAIFKNQFIHSFMEVPTVRRIERATRAPQFVAILAGLRLLREQGVRKRDESRIYWLGTYGQRDGASPP